MCDMRIEGLVLCGPQRRERRWRNQCQEAAALAALELLEGEAWIRAIDLAEIAGLRWRPLAFALRRLVARGLVEDRLVRFRAAWKNSATAREYRRIQEFDNPFLPKPAPVRGARTVRGRFGLQRTATD